MKEDQAPASLLYATHDLATRFFRLLKRVKAALTCAGRSDTGDGSRAQRAQALQDALTKALKTAGERLEEFSKWLADPPQPVTKGELDAVVRQLAGAAEELRGSLCGDLALEPLLRQGAGSAPSSAEGYFPGAKHMDLRDALELLQWHELRTKILKAELDDSGTGTLVTALGGPAPKKSSASVRALTGYCCEGSWFVGVERTTQSPGLAIKFIAEMTSTGKAEERGERGAGIPSRKDFFEFHGQEAVPGFPYMRWNELLRFSGARARRRDRTTCPDIQVSKAFEVIHPGMMHCLRVAEEQRLRYQKDTTRPDALKKMRDVAQDVVAHLFRQVGEAMRDAKPSLPGQLLCFACPARESCTAIRKKSNE